MMLSDLLIIFVSRIKKFLLFFLVISQEKITKKQRNSRKKQLSRCNIPIYSFLFLKHPLIIFNRMRAIKASFYTAILWDVGTLFSFVNTFTWHLRRYSILLINGVFAFIAAALPYFRKLPPISSAASCIFWCNNIESTKGNFSF
jgi:hypothetical protein